MNTQDNFKKQIPEPPKNIKVFNTKRKPKRRKFVPWVAQTVISWPDLKKRGAKLVRTNMEALDGKPYLLLINHASKVDLNMMYKATHPQPLVNVMTLEGFRALDGEMREGMIDYLSEFSLFEEVKAGGKQFLLVHAGVCGYDEEKDLDDYAPEDFFTAPACENYKGYDAVIVGHVPTASGRIEREGNIVRIDCGKKDGGALACLCLETGEEFYV